MKKVTPERFKAVFGSVVTEPSIQSWIVSDWNNRSFYTSKMRLEVLPSVAKRLELLAYSGKDYYWLDAIFCEAYDHDHFPVNSQFAKYIAVAIEHEHDCGSTVSEMNKLQIYNTPLKVLITYCNSDNKTEELLAKYAKIMREADVFSDFDHLRKQLVIIGKLKGTLVDWFYYVYDGSCFVRI
jgi:hypothetical protein